MTLVWSRTGKDLCTDELLAQHIVDAVELLDGDSADNGADMLRLLDRAFEFEDLERTISLLEMISDRADRLLVRAGYVTDWDVLDGYEIHTTEGK